MIDGTTGDQRFYLGWAQVWRRNYREANLRQRLITDPHSPSEQRVAGRPQPRPLVPRLQRPARPEAVPCAARRGCASGKGVLDRQSSPLLDAEPLDGGAALAAAGAGRGGGGQRRLAALLRSASRCSPALFLAGVRGDAGRGLRARQAPGAERAGPRQPVHGARLCAGRRALDLARDPAALTDGERPAARSQRRLSRRASMAMPCRLTLPGTDEGRSSRCRPARPMAWRDGSGCVAGVATARRAARRSRSSASARRGDLLLWRYPRRRQPDLLATLAAKRVVGRDRRALSHEPACSRRWSTTRAGSWPPTSRSPTALFATGQRTTACASPNSSSVARKASSICWPRARAAPPLRLVHVPVDAGSGRGRGHSSCCSTRSKQRAARFQQHPGAARHAAARPGAGRPRRPLPDHEQGVPRAGGHQGQAKPPSIPAIWSSRRTRRRSPTPSAATRAARRCRAILPIRLTRQPDEPVALTIAGLRGLGDAAVLLLLKDNSEEAKLKRQVAQATKMQAVGQLAGGVAHDFNNILTAIIGHCDLMLMRHTPGDSDYDDIQQIKSNSNRAAGLTRQLLAFSRQQTLRPQVLQLPDVVSEVSHLLKRLLGETVAAGRQARPRPRPGPRRPRPARAGDHQSRGQRPRRHGRQGRRDADHPDLCRARPTRSPSSAPTSCRSPIIRRCRSADTGTGIRAERARQGVRALLHHQGGRQGHRASAFRPSTASSSSRAASSSPIPRSARARASPSTCRSTEAEATARRRAPAKPQDKRAVGHRHRPAGRGRADGPHRRRAGAHPPRLHRDHRQQRRGGAGDPRRAARRSPC